MSPKCHPCQTVIKQQSQDANPNLQNIVPTPPMQITHIKEVVAKRLKKSIFNLIRIYPFLKLKHIALLLIVWGPQEWNVHMNHVFSSLNKHHIPACHSVKLLKLWDSLARYKAGGLPYALAYIKSHWTNLYMLRTSHVSWEENGTIHERNKGLMAHESQWKSFLLQNT